MGELGFCVEFGVFAAVGEEGVEVGEEVSVSIIENSLEVALHSRRIEYQPKCYTS